MADARIGFDSMPDSLRGHFLIAARHLRDPNFFKSVVFIVEHGAGGAMGLVVNRPSGVTVAAALVGHLELPETDDMVFFGGPVEPSGLFILHNGVGIDADEPEVVPGLYVGGSAEIFEEVVKRAVDGDPQIQFRIFSGCAGWSDGQLEGELSRNDWLVLPARHECVFSHNPYELWDNLRLEYSRLHSLAARNDGSAELN
jgi:putative transcriptional regulator